MISSGGLMSAQSVTVAGDIESVYKWISALANMETRETALLELWFVFFACNIRYSKKRESVPELAPFLWNSCGSIAALLQEICAIYPYINPPNLNVGIYIYIS